MRQARTKTFRSGNSEAVRLPRELAFGEGVELTIIRSGDVMTIYPTRNPVAAMIARLRALPAPPNVERREEAELPERSGL